MSNQISIQLELETVLSAIEGDTTKVLSEVIKKLLMADYEGFTQINELGVQMASLRKEFNEFMTKFNKHFKFEEEGKEEEEEEEEEVVIEDADESK